jgi:urease gamma subunit
MDESKVVYKRVYGVLYARRNKGVLAEEIFENICIEAKAYAYDVREGIKTIEEFKQWAKDVVKQD